MLAHPVRERSVGHADFVGSEQIEKKFLGADFV
jgi:hypothetical protein